MSKIIRKILASEKSFQDTALGKFSFVVNTGADKSAIAEEIETIFGVNVVKVNTMRYKGKIKFIKKHKGRRSDFTKAIVQLKSGQKIDLFEVESKEKESEKKSIKKEIKPVKTENPEVEVKIKEKK